MYIHRQVATLLLNKDADSNVLIPMHGVTPFHLVIGNDSKEFAEVTKVFLRRNANVRYDHKSRYNNLIIYMQICECNIYFQIK